MRLANDYIVEDHSSSDGTQTVTAPTAPGAGDGQIVRLAADYGVEDFTTDSGKRLLQAGDNVLVADGHDATKGVEGRVYQYLGTKGRIELGAQDYTDTSKWKLIGGEAGEAYRYIGTTASLDLGLQDYSDATKWKKLAGTPGAVYQYMGTTQALNLSSQDYTDLRFWKPVTETQLIPQGNNISDSNAMALGGLVVRNDVRSDVGAYIKNATVTGSGLAVTALEDAVIRAVADSSAEASGGSAYGSGSTLAVNATIATNLILSQADAYIEGSSVTTTTTGDIVLDAQNTSQIDAKTLASTTSGGEAVGVTLAFNTIGWKSQNVLYNTIDALLGTSIGQEQSAQVQAYIKDSSITAGGDLTLMAFSEATINADISNQATSAASALVNASGMSVGVVLASNMVSSEAKAYIDDAAGAVSVVTAGGAVTISGEDAATINADSTLVSMSTTSSDGGLSIAGDLVSTMLTDYRFTVHSGTQNVQTGDLVRLDNGDIYQYKGTATAGQNLNLATVPYTTATWQRILINDALDFIGNLGLNVSSSDSAAVGGLIVRNDVRGGVESYINNIDLDAAGSLTLTALETATIRAVDSSTVTSVGGSVLVGGNSAAINGTIATNLVLSKANAYITGSSITTTNAGDVILDAQNTSTIEADIDATTESRGVSVGVILAFNTIGWASQNVLYNLADTIAGSDIAASVPAEVRAYIANSNVDAAGGLSITATSDAAIEANMGATSTAIKATLASSTAVSVGAVIGMNKVNTLVQAYVDGGATVTAGSGDINIQAQDSSAIHSVVTAASLSVSASTSSALSVSVGLSLARNEIKNDMTAFMRNVGLATATNGSVTIGATENADIDATSTASSVTIALSASGGKSFGGGGATAVNYIRGKSNAYIEGSTVSATGTGAGMGAVTVTSDNASSIDAKVAAISVAAAAGAGSSPAASIGFSLARNFIGWDSSGGASVTTTYTSAQRPTTLTAGQTVKILDGARAGDIYEYVGSTLTDGDPNTAGTQTVDLTTQNYQDKSAWKQINVNASALEAQAYIKNSSVTASGALTLDADSTASISAIVVAGSGALAGGGSTGLALSGAGVYAENRIKTYVKAYIDGDGSTGISAASALLRVQVSVGRSQVQPVPLMAVAVRPVGRVSVTVTAP
ncbi:MAG: hypothetical protein U1A72_06305, partial [Sulfuritalea sp.]|nr:hypothetical protein [Sulfuritalea sp.]